MKNKYPAINKRKDGRWQASLSIGHDSSGKLVRKTISGATQKEVKQKIDEMRAQVQSGEITPETRTDLTLTAWLNEYFDTYCSTLAMGTQRSYRAALRKISNYFENKKLHRLTPVDCQKFVNYLVENGLKRNTISSYRNFLYEALQKAVELDFIPKNPLTKVKLPKMPKPSIHPLDEKELSAFFDAAETSQYFNLYRILVLTGVRISEALALQWSDIKGEFLSVSKQFAKVKSDTTFYPTKNKKSRRIPIPKIALEIFDEIKREQSNNNPLNLIFTDKKGNRLTHIAVWENYKKIAKSIGKEDTTIHDLRHTYAMLNLKSGNDPKLISESLGHATVNFTLDVYAYTTEDMKKKQAENFQNLLEDLDI